MGEVEHKGGLATQGGGQGLWTVQQAAEYLGMSVSWLYRKVEEGLVPAVRLGTGKRAPLRFRQAELDAWVSTQGAA